MAVLLSDAFTRADSTTSPGSPDVGGPYTVVTGTAGISSNRLYFPTVSTSGTFGSYLTFPADDEVDMQVSIPVIGASSNRVGLLFRYASATSSWFWGWSTSDYVLSHLGTTSFTALNTEVSPTNGDVLRVVAKGNRIFGWLNGNLVATAYDHLWNASTDTTAGVVIQNTSTRMDDLTVSDAEAADPPYALTGLAYKGRDTSTADQGEEA